MIKFRVLWRTDGKKDTLYGEIGHEMVTVIGYLSQFPNRAVASKWFVVCAHVLRCQGSE